MVNTNEGSYGEAPTSDQFIGMTRMRAVELGVPIIHAAVTGKSVFIGSDGDLGEVTGLGTMEILTGIYGGDSDTPYTATGDLLMYLAALAGLAPGSSGGSASILERAQSREFVLAASEELKFEDDPDFNDYDADAEDPLWKATIKSLIG